MMKNNIKISVIITVYNAEKYIEESILSLNEQTFTDFELIIVNDGSTDSTGKICKDLTPRLKFNYKYVEHYDNKKIPIRANEAISLAQGEYIAIQDADDISLSDRFEKQVIFLDKNKEIFALGGQAKLIDTDGHGIGRLSHVPINHSEIIRQILANKNPIINPTAMFRKSNFYDLGEYSLDTKVLWTQDFDLWVRAVKAKLRLHNLNDYLVKYRKNPQGNTIKHKDKMMQCHINVLRRFLERK